MLYGSTVPSSHGSDAQLSNIRRQKAKRKNSILDLRAAKFYISILLANAKLDKKDAGGFLGLAVSAGSRREEIWTVTRSEYG